MTEFHKKFARLAVMLLCVLGLVYVFASVNNAKASDYGGDTYITNNYPSTTINNTETGVSEDDLHESTAKALSCDHSFYMGTRRWMGSIQGAVYHGQSAICAWDSPRWSVPTRM